jgi:hypothetical protein
VVDRREIERELASADHPARRRGLMRALDIDKQLADQAAGLAGDRRVTLGDHIRGPVVAHDRPVDGRDAGVIQQVDRDFLPRRLSRRPGPFCKVLRQPSQRTGIHGIEALFLTDNDAHDGLSRKAKI